MIQLDSSPIQSDSRVIQPESQRIRPPHWYEFEAATPVNQQYKVLRVLGFATCVSGAVVDMYLSRPPTEQVLALLGCTLYALIFDPFAAIGALLARASRVILASSIVLIGITIIVPSTGLLVATGMWSLTSVAVVRRFNRRYLMQDTFASAKAIPDAIRTAPESKAGQAWRHGGAKTVNGMAAELGATCKDYAEIKVRELAYYIGYQTADGRTQELIRRCEKLRLENSLYKSAEAEKNDLQRAIEEMSEENRKRLERANIERQRLLKKIEELENVNAELVRSVPDDAPVGDDTESKLEYAFLTLHLTDREAAEYAGCAPAKAWRYRKDKGISPKGGNT
jgi:hypothetical protein